MQYLNTPEPAFPMSAIIGQPDLRLALILTAVAPRIGGVVIRGGKGTAKTTAVRSFAALLDDAPLVNLPLAATEDALIGSVDLESVLSTGAAQLRPGLLARADGGVLYVDEVNLLADHLADVLLDASATGQVSVERDGVSLTSRSDFLLVGTMNPEEGELRPQLLDRFGLAVDVRASVDPAERAEIVRRRLAFDRDPQAFCARWATADTELAGQIRSARARFPQVEISDAALQWIAHLCATLGVVGLRADIVAATAARAHAAWAGRGAVTDADIEAVAPLVLAHRTLRESTPEEIEQALEETPPADQPPAPPTDGEPESGAEEPHSPAEHSESEPGETDGPAHPEAGGRSEPAGQGTPQPTRLLTLARTGAESASPGRRSAAYSAQGADIRAVPEGHGIHLIGTVQAAAERGARIIDHMLQLQGEDLRGAQRRGKESNLIVVVMDTSGSMAAAKRVESVTGAITAMLTDAYQRRDKVAVITAGGSRAEVVLPPTRSVALARRRMSEVPVGGRTPLAQALVEAHDLIAREHLREPGRRALLVVITDGQDTSPAGLGGVTAAARQLNIQGLSGNLVIDCEKRGRIRLGLAGQLAEQLGAPCVAIGEMTSENLVGAIAL